MSDSPSGLRLRDLSDRLILEEVESFYQQCSGFMNVVASVVASDRYALPRRPRSMGVKQFPYFYALDLYELFEFARGALAMSPSYVEKKCDEVLQLLYTTIAGVRVSPDWETFRQTPLGLCVLACGARLSLQKEDGVIRLMEVQLLSDWSEKQLQHHGLVPTADESGEVVFASSQVRAVFEEHGLSV